MRLRCVPFEFASCVVDSRMPHLRYTFKCDLSGEN